MFKSISNYNEPSIMMHEQITIDKWYYKNNHLNRGDLIVFSISNEMKNALNNHETSYFISRCVGLPGDEIEIRNFRLYVNGKLQDDYPVLIESAEEIVEKRKETLHDAGLGDQDIGDFYYDQLLKKVKNAMPGLQDFGPVIVSENSFFCLGDNRSNSIDSREGFLVNNSQLIGKVKYIYWSNNILRIGTGF